MFGQGIRAVKSQFNSMFGNNDDSRPISIDRPTFESYARDFLNGNSYFAEDSPIPAFAYMYGQGEQGRERVFRTFMKSRYALESYGGDDSHKIYFFLTEYKGEMAGLGVGLDRTRKLPKRGGRGGGAVLPDLSGFSSISS